MQRIYSLNFSIGELPCRLTAICPHFEKTSAYFHRHPVFELHYVSSGICAVKTSLGLSEATVGQAILIAPGVYHCVNQNMPNVDKMSLSFEILQTDTPHLDRDSRLLLSAMNTAPISVLDITNSAGSVPLLDVLEQIRTLADHYEDELVQREQMRALAALLFLGLFQKLTYQRPQPTLEPTDSISQRDFLIDEFFNLHFGLNDGNERLAKLLCISPRQLDRILRKSYGMSYREKLTEIRIEVSMDLLLTTEKSVAEISEMVGYSSPANFSTFIKNVTGKTPSAIRREREKYIYNPE